MGSVGQLGAAHPGAMPPAGAYRGKASRPWRRDVSQRGLLGGFDRTVMQPRSRHAASPGGHEAPGGGGGRGGGKQPGPGLSTDRGSRTGDGGTTQNRETPKTGVGLAGPAGPEALCPQTVTAGRGGGAGTGPGPAAAPAPADGRTGLTEKGR